MKALDLFCGGGGASEGLSRAGFDRIVGVDLNPQPEYPFVFLQKDALLLSKDLLKEVDLIWASPPCQHYSIGASRSRAAGKIYPDLVAAVREVLRASGKPYVIENVPGAPLRKDLLLCGTMFNLSVIRHRHFEISGFRCAKPLHPHHTGQNLTGNPRSRYTSVAGNGGNTCRGKLSVKYWQDAMGIDWITDRHTLAQCVPPAYSEYIGREFLREYCLTGEKDVEALRTCIGNATCLKEVNTSALYRASSQSTNGDKHAEKN